VDHVRILSGSWRSQDTFFLATDALARWLLCEHEADRPPWPRFRDLGTEAEEQPFAQLVTELRSDRGLHNDDVTLLRIEVT
jgi:hypothetical protein